MSFTPIDPKNDSRVKHQYALLNGRRFHYVIGEPTSGRAAKATVVLIHGFPDLWYGWRHTIPALLALDLRVIAIDCVGYGGTDAPRCPPEELSAYAISQTTTAIAELLQRMHVHKAVIIGHDWGAMVAWRFVNYHPDLTSHLATLCVPYTAPNKDYIPLEQLVQFLPNFTYQLALAKPETAEALQDKDSIRRFLLALHRASDERPVGTFNVSENIVASVGDNPPSRIMTADELEYYVEQYFNRGFDGPLNWYRTRKENWRDEQKITDPKIRVPTLFIAASNDRALPPAMAVGQEEFVPELTYREVEAGHWAMSERKEEVNSILKEWFEGVVFGGKSKL